MWQADLGNGKYRNPVLYADYSDPDAIRVGEDYFMLQSSFWQVPGRCFTFKRFSQLESSQLCIGRVTGIPLPQPIHGCGVWDRQSGIMKEPIIYVFRCRMRAFT